MPTVKMLYEVAENIHRVLNCGSDENEIVISKKRKIRKYDVDGKKVEPIIFEQKTFWGRMFCLPLWRYIPLYKGSYKHMHVVPFGEVVKGQMDAKMYKAMSEEDSQYELLRSDRDSSVILAYLGVGVLIGAFAVYVLMSGDLSGILGG